MDIVITVTTKNLVRRAVKSAVIFNCSLKMLLIAADSIRSEGGAFSFGRASQEVIAVFQGQT